MPAIKVPGKGTEKTPGSNSLHLTVKGKLIGSIPNALLSIFEEIERSKYILDLKDNWNDDDAVGYTFDAWKKAVQFIIKLSAKIYNTCNQVISTPKIYHGPNGSIDIYWENEAFNLLINIPPNGPGTFYGDNYKNNKVEGAFDPSIINLNLFPFLIERNG